MKLKTLNLFFCVFLLTHNISANSNVKKSKKNQKIISLCSENKMPDGVFVTLFKEDEESGWINQGNLAYNTNGFSVTVIENTNYIIKITKKGYASRTYCFSTELNSKETISNIKFSFDLNFFKNKNEEDNLSDLSVSLTCNNLGVNCVAINKL